MAILDFIKRTSRRDLRRMLLLTVVAGFANAFLVVVVNHVAGLVAHGDRPGLWSCLAFAAAFAIYFFCDRFALLRANRVIERLLKDLRAEVMDKLRRSELQVVDKVGRGNLYTIVSRGTNELSTVFPPMVENFQQAVLLAVSLIYLGYLSVPALLVFLAAVLFGYFGYRHITRDFRETLQEITRQQGRMLDAIGDFINGSKELRLNAKRSDAVFRAYQTLSSKNQRLLTRSGDHSTAVVTLANLVVYSMLGVVAFILPQYTDAKGTSVLQLIPILLFCMAPLVKIASQFSVMFQADVALNVILGVERQLEAGGSLSPHEARDLVRKYRNFEHISYADLTLSYRDTAGDSLFTAGPCDLTLTRGETVFLVGGNGSGKSTVLRLITGLYKPDQGRIAVNGIPVEGREIAGLRELFSAIFVDFHLFDRLYGSEQADPAEVRRLIAEMGLEGKVRFEDGRFTDLDLSTGQRKRLALIAALLEDRPIYVFDEWAAEQDVHFREQFYTRIIPGLKAQGKTVVAATHDDRFWHLADRVIKLDLGTVAWERAGAELAGDQGRRPPA